MRSVAIVDSRNMHGQGLDLLGVTRNPTARGLAGCLGRFGFELTESYFSVALPREADRRDLRRLHDENSQYMSSLLRQPRVHVLQGELHRLPDDSVREKLVDVLCAVEAVRQAKHISDGASDAETVLLLSQDLDVRPGVELALEFGVHVLTVSSGAIHRRGYPYLILPEPALADLLEVTGPCGQAVRTDVARMARYPSVDSWEYLYVTSRWTKRPMALMLHRHGALGVADPDLVSGADRGDLLDLTVQGVVPGDSSRFPVLALADGQPSRGTDLVEGTVVGRFRLFRVTIALDGGSQAKVFAGNCHLTPSTPVLLQRQARGGVEKYRYIGALADPPPLVGCGGVELGAMSLVVSVTEHRKDGHALAASEEPAVAVFLPRAAADTEVGGRYLVTLAGEGRDRDSPFVGHLASSRLPVSQRKLPGVANHPRG